MHLSPHILPALVAIVLLSACEPLEHMGRAPDFSPLEPRREHAALYGVPLPDRANSQRATDGASLWSASQRSLLGDRRASRQGDILTVVIEINDRAEISNSSERGRTGALGAGAPEFFGLPDAVDRRLPGRLSLARGVELEGSSSFQGSGSVSRNERLTLRVATTIVERLPNGVMRLEGSQEVRVNNELRELLVSGYIRPEDISRRNEIPYDRIAGARISYGGRGHISQMQQPRYGQQIADMILPF
ncbi:MAG: flagellar L-ring protein precursor FlgH [Rhodobacteraceae bacterium HLUCCA12]|nr:MAG: flagellar L-ring protein precursor FlgH [Rhodobacteraceae bacterium HLUCCA12]